ncbi:calcium/calmodulin-dependent protein kinase kinase 2/serine/threonine-protein kinase ssp1 [Blumeria hordei DH14]|uniref:non-specific serine/threonine protein kinase n=1 Tax=Blumeria graminis f. sp. hordei (strain DH14) TaxID=546991 RepID=N1J618_BLUG1|nr:calcium/calmodulin-dependent protein kinase kinase 2/serine/threonine-protein kinase ssp1 [Blumeria hordei DH14]
MDSQRSPLSTPISSPGLFSPSIHPHHVPSDGTPHSSPYLHPLQMHKVRETNKAQVEQDFITGRKLINQYEIINEIGRGVHGKVKLARSLETGEFVAIKIIQRFSKKRKLGRVTFSPEDKTKREIAILKKVRHANVVGLLEVIDDPELMKIYMVLEHVELGEIVWRRKGTLQICRYERHRIEKEQLGDTDHCEDEKYFKMMERRRFRKLMQRAKISQLQLVTNPNHWSLEHGDEDEDMSIGSRDDLSTSHVLPIRRFGLDSNPGSRISSRPSSRATSRSFQSKTPLPSEFDLLATDPNNNSKENIFTQPIPFPSPHFDSYLDAPVKYGSYNEGDVNDIPYRDGSPCTTASILSDSIISHMSSIDNVCHDAFEEDYSYVPCFTIDQARSAFRDTVLGLEYLHYEGIVHRDIKPANLLWTKDHRVKISDFGVSYFGRPTRDGETEENISETDATDFDDDLELAKTVGTPAFFAPELCCTDINAHQPKVTEQIDVWSLGITLYCLIFARIPFLADDEWQLFRCIAKEDVYIPRRRLKAVNQKANTPPGNILSSSTSPNSPYREENELAFEIIDDELFDLLRRMLIKDPAERIKLREVKRHPWLLRGLDDIIGWLDDTDPSRVTAGRRIEVDRHELERAVVPITFLERARTAVKKAVGKVIGVTRSDTKSDGSKRSRRSRRRAVSSTTSSGTDTHSHTPITPILKDSLRGDESYVSLYTHSQEAYRQPSDYFFEPGSNTVHDKTLHRDLCCGTPPSISIEKTTQSRRLSLGPADRDFRPGGPECKASNTNSTHKLTTRGHSYSKSVNTTNFRAFGDESKPPVMKSMATVFDIWQSPRDREALVSLRDNTISRVHSVDRKLFDADNKHAQASVAVSITTAPGHFQHPPLSYSRRKSQSANTSPTDKAPASPLFIYTNVPRLHKSAEAMPNQISQVGKPSDVSRNFPQESDASESKIYPTSLEMTSSRRTYQDDVATRSLQLTPDSATSQLSSYNSRSFDKTKVSEMGFQTFRVNPTMPGGPFTKTNKEFGCSPLRSSKGFCCLESSIPLPELLDSQVPSLEQCSGEQISPSLTALPVLTSGYPISPVETKQADGLEISDFLSFHTMGDSNPESFTRSNFHKRAITDVDNSILRDAKLLSSGENDRYKSDGNITMGYYNHSPTSEHGLILTRRQSKIITRNPQL